MAWTFDEQFDLDVIEAAIELLKKWEDEAYASGFIDLLVFAVHFAGPDGDDHYVSRVIGNGRMLTGLGLMEAMKIDYMRHFDEGPFSGFIVDDDDDE